MPEPPRSLRLENYCGMNQQYPIMQPQKLWDGYSIIYWVLIYHRVAWQKHDGLDFGLGREHMTPWVLF